MTCFFPSGKASQIDQVCNASAPVSHCCAPDSVCLSNGYCLNAGRITPYLLSRGTCTDQAFRSPLCSQQCRDINTSGGLSIFSITDGPGEAQYCCGKPSKNGTCASTNESTTPFTIEMGYVIANRSDGSEQPRPITVTQSVPGTEPTCSSSPSVYLPKNTSRETTIGAGVGVPFGALMVVAFVAWIFQLQKTKKLQRELRIRDAYVEDLKKLGTGSEKILFRHQLSGTPLAEMPAMSHGELDGRGID